MCVGVCVCVLLVGVWIGVCCRGGLFAGVVGVNEVLGMSVFPVILLLLVPLDGGEPIPMVP